MLVVQFCENDDYNEVNLQVSDEKQNKSQRRPVKRQGTDVMYVNIKLQEIKLYKSYMEKALHLNKKRLLRRKSVFSVFFH